MFIFRFVCSTPLPQACASADVTRPRGTLCLAVCCVMAVGTSVVKAGSLSLALVLTFLIVTFSRSAAVSHRAAAAATTAAVMVMMLLLLVARQ